jgi:hypothetical protein
MCYFAAKCCQSTIIHDDDDDGWTDVRLVGLSIEATNRRLNRRHSTGRPGFTGPNPNRKRNVRLLMLLMEKPFDIV